MTRPEPLMFQLYFRKQHRTRMAGVWVDGTAEEIAALPDVPDGFKPMRGYHAAVSKQADLLNRAQERSGFMHYFFFPDVAETAGIA